ncbi:3-oxoacyl-(acyl-carrier protein) reductase, putative [Luminiphilus syltensis NOR5-1B]|uniref:3-oxoacyl-(Acyl-carrier protein) reductase, putative n=1 Tax=Luminiphilus syltensis NOR5-1B TaxID=565045 RepID=B8KWV3_9GAMM|nr:SDR family oxidoreductase [Luminiphilus syltensis]EED36752.1 3-oxoacyl-(acyl-carrier protein) reductase, putative [Luminiphilus syltensis NOR5-1B]
MKLADKVCVVTGAGSGIGRAIAERFHAEGAIVAVVDRDEQSAKACATALDGMAFAVDVRDEAQMAAMVAEVERIYGHIDLFCSNAGILATDGEPWWATSASNAVWQAMWEVHVMAHVYAARACLPRMIERKRGYFLNVASAAGLLNQIGDAAYSTTKHAAVGWAEALAITHGDDGIKVSCVCPQAVDTEMIAGIDNGGTAGLDGVLTTEAVAAAVVEGVDQETFLILPHPQVNEYRVMKAENYDRWIGGMKKLRRLFGNPKLS